MYISHLHFTSCYIRSGPLTHHWSRPCSPHLFRREGHDRSPPVLASPEVHICIVPIFSGIAAHCQYG